MKPLSPTEFQIILIRHSKAESDELVFSDRERRLTKSGRKDAEKSGDYLASLSISPDLILTSPAQRAIETAQRISTSISYPEEKIRISEVLYSGDAGLQINLIRQTRSEIRQLIIIGHNPMISDLLTWLTGSSGWSLPTSGIAGIRFESSDWNSIQPGSGTIVFVHTPSDKVKHLPEFAPAKSRIEHLLFETLYSLTKHIGESSMSKIEKEVKSLTDQFLKKVLKAVKDAEKKATAAPKKRGRKPAAKAAKPAADAAPKKRGRKPAAKAAKPAVAKAPAKRGRKPAAKAAKPAVAKAPAKRGPKPAAKKAVTKTGAKRGRKPKVAPAPAPAATPAPQV